LKRGNPKILSARLNQMEGGGCKYSYYYENPVRIEHFPIETGLATTGVDIMAAYSTKYHSKDVFKEVYQRAITKISF
jgi:hypothetical protein